jgi:uncharacterized protein
VFLPWSVVVVTPGVCSQITMQSSSCIPLSFAIKYYPVDWVVWMIKGSDAPLLPYHVLCAIERGWGDILFALIEKDVEITPVHLHYAIEKGMPNTVKSMITRHPKLLEARDVRNCTPLMTACDSKDQSCALVLIHMGADAHARDDTHLTPLMLAAKKGHHHVVNALLQTTKDIDVNRETKGGSTALTLAAEHGCHYTVNALLDTKGIDVNHINLVGDAALHFAAHNGHVRAVRLLLKHGANVSLGNLKNSTAADYAYNSGHVDILRLLMEHGSPLPKIEMFQSSEECKAFVSGYKAATKM